MCLVLALYGFAVFGCITVTFASLFIGLDTKAKARMAEAAASDPPSDRGQRR